MARKRKTWKIRFPDVCHDTVHTVRASDVHPRDAAREAVGDWYYDADDGEKVTVDVADGREWYRYIVTIRRIYDEAFVGRIPKEKRDGDA